MDFGWALSGPDPKSLGRERQNVSFGWKKRADKACRIITASQQIERALCVLESRCLLILSRENTPLIAGQQVGAPESFVDR